MLGQGVGDDVGLIAVLDGHPLVLRARAPINPGDPTARPTTVCPPTRYPSPAMEETLSGFKQRGTWADVVEHGERVARALREAGADEELVAEFDEWRPKAHERIDEEVSEKTADQASIEEGAGEEAGREPSEDLQSAGEELSESYRDLGAADAEGAVSRVRDSLDYMARAADTAGRKALRAVEEGVYQTVMTSVAPYYFDNDLISANLTRVRSQEEFVLEVNITEDELKEAVSEELGRYERFDRWHVDTERETSSVEAAEGVTTPETDDDAEPRTN